MSPASPEGGEPEGQKNDSIEAEAECLAEATGIPASVFREAMYPLPDQPPESGDTERVHRLALEAQGPIETLLGIIRLRGELGSTAIPRLEAAHDAIKRIVDGDNWRERWEAVEKGEPAPAPEHGAEGDENTGESKDLAWAVKRLAAFRDDLYHADHSRVRPVVTAYDLQAVEIVLAHLSAPRRAEGDEEPPSDDEWLKVAQALGYREAFSRCRAALDTANARAEGERAQGEARLALMAKRRDRAEAELAEARRALQNIEKVNATYGSDRGFRGAVAEIARSALTHSSEGN
jgi:hypothetical protein